MMLKASDWEIWLSIHQVLRMLLVDFITIAQPTNWLFVLTYTRINKTGTQANIVLESVTMKNFQ
jgi:hypothetical protein